MTTKANLQKKLREIINLRNLLIISIVFLLIPSVSAVYTVQCDNLTTFYYDNAAGEYWPVIHAQSSSTSQYTVTGILKIRNDGTSDKFDELTRVGIVFTLTDIPEGYTNDNTILSLYMTTNNADDISAGPMDIVLFEPSSGPPWANSEFNEFSDIIIGSTDTLTAVNTWVNITLDDGVLHSGTNYIGIRAHSDVINESPLWVSSGKYIQESFTGTSTNRPKLYFDTVSEYDVSISGTGIFCYSYPLSFNVSLDGYTDEYAFYWLHFYKDGDPVSYYTAFDGNDDGYYSFTKSLPPGDYASQGIIEFEEYELEGWLNFSVEDDCSLAFNGTINDTNPYTYSSNYTWEWTYYDYLNNLTPWEAPTMDHGNGTSYIDYMFSLGYINESEYDFIYQRYMDIINQSNNSTATGNEYVFGILTPLEMINDGIITVRSNINGSVSFLSDGISPITSIFGWIIQMMPSWVINLFSIVLAFDATRIILSGRK